MARNGSKHRTFPERPQPARACATPQLYHRGWNTLYAVFCVPQERLDNPVPFRPVPSVGVVAAFLDDDEARARDGAVQILRLVERDRGVVARADDQGWARNPRQLARTVVGQRHVNPLSEDAERSCG